jgi:hypothetical protein
MKPFSLQLVPVLAGILLFVAGCGHLDVAASGDPNRVLKGTIAAGENLPAGTEIVVRLIATAPRPPAGDSNLGTRTLGPAAATERVLGEQRQILAAFTTAAVPFQVEYQADDALLRRGVNIDARISVGGKLRFRTINAHVVTLSSAPYPQEVAVQPVQ